MLKYKSWDELLQGYSLKYGDKTVLTYTEDDRKVTWREFYDNISKIAVLFSDSGIKKGDRISILTRNSPEFIYSFFAAMRLGAIFNPINPDSTEDEIEFIMNDSGTSIVIADEENYKRVNAIKDKVASLKHVFGNEFSANEIIILEQYLVDNTKKDFSGVISESSLSDDCLIMYSSGTTGKPKGIVLTQSNIMVEAFSIARAWHFNEQGIGMCTLPLFFSGGLMPGFLATLVTGGSLVLQKKFSKSKFFSNIAKYNVSYTNVVPTILSMLLNPPEDISSYNLSNFKLLACSAAPLPVELAVNFEKQFVNKGTEGFRVIEAYGLTENSCWCSLNTPDNRLIGSIGKAMDVCVIKIADSSGNHLPPNNEGEIIVKGSIIFPRYWNNEEKTRESLKDGWLHTGDLGHIDEHGNISISGRIKEIIIKGGENISPTAIDEVFYRHDAVIDAATIGIPDEIYGEEIKTYVATNRNITEAELMQYAQQHISSFRCPKEIVIIDKIPKGPSGKLLRRELLEIHLTSSSR